MEVSMKLAIDRTAIPTVPTEEESRLARSSSQRLTAYLQDKKSQRTIRIIRDSDLEEEESIVIPEAAFDLLIEVLAQMAQGNAVNITPLHAELTTQEAADILNVSRPYLVELLETGQIPFRKVGTRRRVRCEDVLNYKREIDSQRMKVLEELAAQAQELNMGYD
jgi:excisionase family DNA binding protein